MIANECVCSQNMQKRENIKSIINKNILSIFSCCCCVTAIISWCFQRICTYKNASFYWEFVFVFCSTDFFLHRIRLNLFSIHWFTLSFSVSAQSRIYSVTSIALNVWLFEMGVSVEKSEPDLNKNLHFYFGCGCTLAAVSGPLFSTSSSSNLDKYTHVLCKYFVCFCCCYSDASNSLALIY